MADGLYDGGLALVRERPDAAEVVVEPEVGGERPRLRHHRAGELGPEIVERRVRDPGQRPQSVVSARKLDHQQHVVVGDAPFLGPDYVACEFMWNRAVARPR